VLGRSDFSADLANEPSSNPTHVLVGLDEQL
jgi:hypothetical protein